MPNRGPEPPPPLFGPADAELARHLCDSPDGTDNAENVDSIDESSRAAVGWALKAECYAAWSSDPQRAVRAAHALRALSRSDAGSAVLRALADWTEGIACLIRNEMADAVRALDRASERWRAIGQPLHAAHAQVARIMALVVQGRFDEAEASALDTEASLLAQGDEHAAAKVRLNLGSLAFSRDQHTQAVTHYRAAAVRFARMGDREHSVMADIGLADALSFLGRFDEAHQFYARARMRAGAHGLPVLAASADNGSALLALSQGRYPEALAGLESTRRAFAALALEHRLAEAEKSLADAYLELRLLPEAISLYTELVASLRARGALATLPKAQAQLARAQALAGQSDAALSTLAEAAGGFDAQDNAAGRAIVSAVQSELHAAAGRPREALARALQAVAGFAAADLPAHEAAAQVHAAAARIACGEAARALVDCEALLADDTLPPQVQVRARVEHAAALLALSRRDEARTALEAAIEGVEDLRAALPGEDFRRAFLADASRPYVQRLQLALDDASTASDGAADVLDWLERFKARTLQERVGRSEVRAAQDLAGDPVRERLDWIYRRQQRLIEDEGESPQALRDEAVRLERQLLETARRERLLGGSPSRASRPHGTDVPGLRLALGPGRALIEYGAVGDELFAIVVREDGIRLQRRLASWAATVQAVQGLRFQIDAMRAGSALPPEHLPMLAERTQRRLALLHRLVWQPLAAELGGCERLVVVPHGILHGVPFAALCEGELALVDRHELVMAASATVALRGLAHEARAPRSIQALVVGDSARLLHVSAELHAVAAALGGAQLLDGAQASAAALCAAAPGADLLHLACHAEFRSDSPLFSALHLADGALTADRVHGLRLNARLVVLSACESARGESGVADEGVGLVRAFLMAGAQCVLGSHWAVDDAATTELMSDFYRRWCHGERIASALGQAQRALRRTRPHPAHWAAFALHGAG